MAAQATVATPAAGENTSAWENVLRKVKRFREVESLQHDSVPDVAATLDRIAKFLQEHETPTANDATHAVFDKCPDWWQSPRSTFMLSITEDGTLDLLYEYISRLYDLKVPLTLTEHRTPQIRFIQDIHIRGSENNCLTAADLFDTDNAFTKLLGSIMGEIFPTCDSSNDFLDAAVFDASGHSRTRGVMTTSIRVVWSSIIVNTQRAGCIRDYTIFKFKESQDAAILALAENLQADSEDNMWSSIFDDSVYASKQGVRMPLNDRSSPAPLKKPERRPFKPYCVLRFKYSQGKLERLERIAQENDLDGRDWLKIGCIRRDTGTRLSEWVAPVWRGAPQRPSGQGTQAGGGGGGGGYGGAMRTFDQVRVRTQVGSGDWLRRGGGGQREDLFAGEPSMTSEREYGGTVESFRVMLEELLGPQSGTIAVEDGQLTWTRAQGDGAEIHFREANQRVYIRGKTHQIRALLMAIQPFVREVGFSDGRSVVSSRAAPTVAGYAPSNAHTRSAVYAPSAAFAPSEAFGGSTVSRLGGAPSASMEPKRRLVSREFKGETTSELSLTTGQVVLLTHDPDAGDRSNLHRWVYGKCEETGDQGWFPLSSTVPHDRAATGQ